MSSVKNKTKFETLSLEFGKGHQSIDRTELLQFGDYKLKISIKSDAYKRQSYARIYVFKDLEWSRLANIHSQQMDTPEGLCYYTEANEFGRGINVEKAERLFDRKMSADRTELLHQARMILT
jgi:hypothetical protein